MARLLVAAAPTAGVHAASGPCTVVEVVGVERTEDGWLAENDVPHMLQAVAVGRVSDAGPAWRERESS